MAVDVASAPALAPPLPHARGRARLAELTARGRALLGSEHAILAGAMTWVSERRLVSAISNAGGFGVLAAGSMTPDLLAAEIAGTQALTKRPFGVNLITLHPALLDLIAVCREAGVTHIVLAGGLPPGPAVDAIKAAGIKLIAFAPAVAIAKKLVRGGCDGLVIEGSEAGGHIGPVSLSVLAQEVLPTISDVPVFVAGGLGRGGAIAAFVEMGASGAQLGTRFAASAESIAHPSFKRAFVRAAARDAVASVQLDPRFPVIPVRALRNRGQDAFTQKQREVIAEVDAGRLSLAEGQLAIEHYWAGALRRAVIDGDVEHGSMMAGQSVGMVDAEEPVEAIIGRLVDEAAAALDRR